MDISGGNSLKTFFIFIFVGIVLFVIGLVLLFRPGGESSTATVKAKIIQIDGRYYDDVVKIKYMVDGTEYVYVFSTTNSRYKVGQDVWFTHNTNNPVEAAGNRRTTVVHVIGVILLIVAIACVMIGTMTTYYKIQPDIVEPSENNFFRY